jgi:hypothetical protein
MSHNRLFRYFFSRLIFLDKRKQRKKDTIQREEKEELRLGLIETRLNSFKVHSNEINKFTCEDIT